MKILTTLSILLLVLLSNILHGGENNHGVILGKDVEKNLFLFPVESSPHQARSSANEKNLGVILAQARFVTISKMDQQSTFNKYKNLRTVYQESLSKLPVLLCKNTSFRMGRIYYRLYIDGAWSNELNQWTGGHRVTSISLDQKTEKVQITRIQFK